MISGYYFGLLRDLEELVNSLLKLLFFSIVIRDFSYVIFSPKKIYVFSQVLNRGERDLLGKRMIFRGVRLANM